MSETEQDVTLEPCPWCGGKAMLRNKPTERRKRDPKRVYWVMCPTSLTTACKVAAKTRLCDTPQEAAEQWNTRSPALVVGPQGDLLSATATSEGKKAQCLVCDKLIAAGFHFCSKCGPPPDTAPPSTSSAAIRAAAEEIARLPTRNAYATDEVHRQVIAAILSRFGTGETDAAQQVRGTGDDKPGHPLIVREHYHVDTLGHIAKRRCSCSLNAPPHRFVCAVCVESERHTTPAAPSPGEPPPFRTTKEAMEWARSNHVPAVIPVTADRCEHGVSLDHDCLHCENQQDEINVARTSVEGESE